MFETKKECETREKQLLRYAQDLEEEIKLLRKQK